MRISLRRKIAAAFASAVLVLLVGAAAFVSVLHFQRTSSWVTHTYQVIGELNSVVASLRDAQRAERGYLLTGEASYLAPYRAVIPRIESDLAELQRLTEDNPEQQQRIIALQPQVQREIELLQRGIALRDTAGLEAAAALLATGREKQVMDEILTLADEMEQAERALLQERLAEQRETARVALLVIALGGLLAFVLALLIIRAIRRDVAALERAQSDLAMQAEQLQEQATALKRQQAELEARVEESQALARGLESANQQLREAHREAEQAGAEARAALATRSRFLAAMSHELRTPINAIIGYNDLLLLDLYGPLNTAQMQGIERSQKAARHLAELVNDVLDLSKIEAGKLELEPEEVHPPALLEDMLNTVRPLAEQHGASLHMDADDCPEPVTTDPRRVRQILLNLLSNAVKFGAGQPIHVRCTSTTDGMLAIEVRDHGMGIAPGEMERIFEEFVQLKNASGGTGLGLPISRRLAGALGGVLTAESMPGEGSTFRLLLPPVWKGAGTPEGASVRQDSPSPV